MILKDKRILFIAPAFFGYEKKIAEKMTQLGARVDYFDERSITSSLERALLKINPLIFRKKTIGYYNNIIEKIANNRYDFILVIKCEMMPLKVIEKLKELFPAATLCLYLYDSLRNVNGISPKLSKFDRALSFDLNDTEKNKNLIFRPLFFIDDYKKEFSGKDKNRYDISFIGTIHSDRYRVIKEIKSQADKRGNKYFFYCYLQSQFMYYFYRLTKKEFRGVGKEEFRFDKIGSSDIAEIIDNTKVVLDIQHPNQTGLTIRTIEMIGMNKKLITTNESIKKYDFYNPNNIAVINRNYIEIPQEFYEIPFQKVDDKIYLKYSLENWIIDVLGLEG